MNMSANRLVHLEPRVRDRVSDMLNATTQPVGFARLSAVLIALAVLPGGAIPIQQRVFSNAVLTGPARLTSLPRM